MFINLNFGLTDAKLKIRFKYWITQLKINLSMQKVFARIIVKTKLIYTENQTTILRMIMALSKFDLVDGDECQEAFKSSFPYVLSLFSDQGKEAGLSDEAIKYLCHAYSEKTSEGFLRTITKQVALPSKGLLKA